MSVKLSDFGQKIFLDRYSLKDLKTGEPVETIEDTFARVANALGKDPQQSIAFYTQMHDLKFIPGGRILAGIGNEQANLCSSNCIVLPCPKDSREGIFKSVADMAECMARGAGVGINYSSLRPKDAVARGVDGKSSGAVSWIELHSFVTGKISQGGSRRGAHMAMLACWHPDIEEFITHKKDNSRTTNANISVVITDAFMHAVENDLNWNLEFPETNASWDNDKVNINDLNDPMTFYYEDHWNGDLSSWKAIGGPTKVYKTLKARDLFRLIAESAHASAEPGVWFIDTANRLTPLNNGEKLVATNPCLPGSERISTENGMLRAVDMHNDGLARRVLVDSRLSSPALLQASNVFQTGIKPVFRLTTKEGFSVRLTADHRVMTERGWVEAGDLVFSDKIHISDRGNCFGNAGSKELGMVLGWLIADGCMKATGAAELAFFGQKRDYCEIFAKAVEFIIPSAGRGSAMNPIQACPVKGRNETRITSERLGKICLDLGVNKDEVPDVVFRGSRETQVAFLQAIFAADGHVESRGKNRSAAVVLTAASVSLLQDVQRLLVNLGCYGRVYLNRTKAKHKLMPDGKGGKKMYACQASHDLRLTSGDLEKFRDEVGFLPGYQQTKLEAVDGSSYRKADRYLARFDGLVPDGEEMVYDISVPGPAAFVSHCVSLHNCGEQSLPAHGVCNLGHINLSKFVKANAWSERQFPWAESTTWFANTLVDWEALQESVRSGVQFLDSVIDNSSYPMPEIEAQQKKDRRIGLGTLGLGEMLIRLGLRYGSSEAQDFCDNLFKQIKEWAYNESMQMAVYGNAPLADKSHWRKNITLITQAPTGTVGTMLGTSTGIEPFFDWEWERKGRLGTHTETCSVVAEYVEFVGHASANDGFKLPEYFVTAHMITVQEHLEMMKVIQRHTDSSISKTVNMPSSATVEDVEKLYLDAYKGECKGLAIYRDNSRETQVLNRIEKEPEDKVKEDKGHPYADGTYVVGQAKIVTEGEAFVKAYSCLPRGIKVSKRTAAGSLHTTLWYDEAGRFTDVFLMIGKSGSDLSGFVEALGRLVSLQLKTSLDSRQALRDVIEQLSGMGGSSFGLGPKANASVVDAVSKALQEAMDEALYDYQPEILDKLEVKTYTEKVRSGELCPSCGQLSLRRESGCKNCMCGYSACT